MFNKLTMGMIVTFWVIIALIGIYILCYAFGKYRNPDRYYDEKGKIRVDRKNLLWITLLGITTSLIGGFSTHHYVHQAKVYGAIYEGPRTKRISLGNEIHQPWLNMSLSDYKKNRAKSFTQKYPKQGQKNILIVLYRFSCPVCHAIRPEFNKEIAKNKLQNNTFYVESRSPLGKQLVKKNNVKLVPELLYVTKDGKILETQLYTAPNKKAQPRLNKEGLNYYMRLVKENNKTK